MNEYQQRLDNILKQGLKNLNEIRRDNPRYWLYNKKELESLIQQYNNIIDHINDFIAEVE